MTQGDSLRVIHAAFANRLMGLGTVVVAGGAVRDALMERDAKDYDLFLLNTDFSAKARQAVAERVSDLTVIKPLEWHNSEPYLVTTVKWGAFDVQLMCNPAPTVNALLDTFDWNVCLFAFDGTYHMREQIENIGEGKDLKLQNVRFPLSTLRRGFRFSERFKMRIDRADVISLCEKVAKLSASSGPQGATPDMPSLAANVLVDDGHA